MKRIRISVNNAVCLSGVMPEARAVKLCEMLSLPLLAVVCIIDA